MVLGMKWFVQENSGFMEEFVRLEKRTKFVMHHPLLCKFFFKFPIFVLLLFFGLLFSSENTHYIKGMELLNDDKYREAEKEFLIFLKDEPCSSRGCNTLGFIYYKLGDKEKAVKNYRKAISLDEKYATAYNNLGIVYYQDENYAAAKDCFEKAIKHNRFYAKAMVNLGLVYWKTGDKKTAKKMYYKAKETDLKYIKEREKKAREKYEQ